MLKYQELPKVNSERWLSLEDLDGEVWKDIQGFEGLYKISCYGRVKSLGGFHRRLRILVCKKHSHGYLKVILRKLNKAYDKYIHRLVAVNFVNNPNHEDCVNHKDENKKNNHYENLEWCDIAYNNTYGSRLERIANKKRHVYNTKKSKVVVQYTLDGTFVAEYPSVMEAYRNTGFCNCSICDCCRGKSKSSHGFKWFYKNEKN